MTLRQYLKAIQHHWWVVALPALLAGMLGLYSVSNDVPQYQASSTFFVKTFGETSANGLISADQFAQRRVNSYVALLSTDRLAEAVVKRTGLDISTNEVASMIGAAGDVNTVLLTATVTSESEAVTSAVADALAIEFVLLVDAVENANGQQAGVNLELVSGPSVSEVPTQPILRIGLFGIAGLALGVALAIFLELRDTSVRNDEQLEALGVAPVLGRIPFDRGAKDAPLVIRHESSPLRAEAFRQLRTNLQFFDVDRPVQVLVVTSALAGEGKSLTSANLALTMAAAGRRVLVVEADFRRPTLADLFGVERAAGLTDVLAGRATIEEVLQPWGTEGLVVLPCGPCPPNPSELLGSDAMNGMLEYFRGNFDLVIIDTPPLLPVTDAAVLAVNADGVVLVVRQGKTTEHQVALAVRSLTTVGARLLGSIVTFVSQSRKGSYGTYEYEARSPEPAATRPAASSPPTPSGQRDLPPMQGGRRSPGTRSTNGGGPATAGTSTETTKETSARSAVVEPPAWGTPSDR